MSCSGVWPRSSSAAGREAQTPRTCHGVATPCAEAAARAATEKTGLQKSVWVVDGSARGFRAKSWANAKEQGPPWPVVDGVAGPGACSALLSAPYAFLVSFDSPTANDTKNARSFEPDGASLCFSSREAARRATCPGRDVAINERLRMVVVSPEREERERTTGRASRGRSCAGELLVDCLLDPVNGRRKKGCSFHVSPRTFPTRERSTS